MQILQAVSRFLGWPRRQLPGLYEDGWQAGSILDDAKGAGTPQGVAALRRGVEILTGQLVATPLLVFDANNTEAPQSAVARCLARTSPADLEAAGNDMLWLGNGWLKIHHDGNGEPHHLEHVQAFRTSAAIEEGRCVYRVDGQPIEMADHVHLMCRNAQSSFVGDPLAESYSTSIAGLMATNTIFRSLQDNGSYNEVTLLADLPLSAEEKSLARTSYLEKSRLVGGERVTVMSHGIKPFLLRRLPTALEADVVKSLDFTVAEASRITGVPLGLLGVKDAVAYNSAVETFRSFYKVTVRPLMHRVEQELTAKLGATVKYDLGELVLGYGVERADVLGKLMYSGIVTLNEARHTLGYSPAADGDIHGLPSNQIPLHTWLTNGEKPAPQPPAEPPASV